MGIAPCAGEQLHLDEQGYSHGSFMKCSGKSHQDCDASRATWGDVMVMRLYFCHVYEISLSICYLETCK